MTARGFRARKAALAAGVMGMVLLAPVATAQEASSAKATASFARAPMP
jgi:uncharacterized protein with LGFP repeats